MSLESTSKQNNMSEEETVSREWEGRKVRWKRFFPTWKQESEGEKKNQFPILSASETTVSDSAS